MASLQALPLTYCRCLPMTRANQTRIIIVEDDTDLADLLAQYLLADGYEVDIAANASELRRIHRAKAASLILLDLNLGNEDGLKLAYEFASHTTLGIIIITGRAALQDRIEGLDAGADDYIIKPFEIDELRARVRAVLRRRLPVVVPEDEWLSVGAVRLNLLLHVLHTAEGTSVTLTETETAIIAELLRHHGRAVSRASLAWSPQWTPNDRSIDVHISNIRRKLKSANCDCLVILPIRGHGYRLRVLTNSGG